VTVVLANAAVGPLKIFAPCGAEYFARGLRLGEALGDGPVAAHFAGGEIAQSDAQAVADVTRNRPAEAYLEVIGMGAEDEQIDHGLNG
jgi:hypothetical protein